MGGSGRRCAVTQLTLTFSRQGPGQPQYLLWFAEITSNISATVTLTDSSPVPEGTVLRLLDAAGNAIVDASGDPITTTAGPGGAYSFVDVASQGYSVAVVAPDGYTVVGPAQRPAAATAGDVTGVDFVLQMIPVTTTTLPLATPAAPAVTDAACTGGQLTAPALSLATTSGITYSTDQSPPFRAGDQVVVTATLGEGYAWPASLPEGWTESSPSEATYVVGFADASCVVVSPDDPLIVQATCSEGEVIAPTLTLAPVDGISYLVTPTDLGDGTADVEVTVAAALAEGYEWGQLPEGWTQVDLVTATFSAVLEGTSCTEITPVSPSVVQSQCVEGALSDPSLTLATTDRITYSVDNADPAPGDAVIVTASLPATTDAFPLTLPPGWSRQSARVATYSLTFDDVACVLATPLDPVVEQATCIDGTVTRPDVTTPETDGVSYVLAPPGPFVGTVDTPVTVTAVLSDGFAWGTIPVGWTQVDAVTATFAADLAGDVVR